MSSLLGRAIIATAFVVASTVSGNAGLDGNALLREAAKMHPLPQHYSVPINFTVHFHRPIPLTVGASAMLYFRAPDKSAVVITSVPKPIAKQIAGIGHVPLTCANTPCGSHGPVHAGRRR